MEQTNYEVTIEERVRNTFVVEVKADSKDEAEKLATEIVAMDGYPDEEHTISTEVTLVRKI